MSGETYSFACKCGARLQARPEMAGKRGKCRSCGESLLIPEPPGSTAKIGVESTGGLTSPARRPEKIETCSICQTVLQPGEASTSCTACGLPFHADCWQANFGCATYGCKNVNVLKPGPDIAINQVALSQANVPPSGPPPWQSAPAPAKPSKPDIPWEYILLAVSAVAGLLSCVACGLPPLFVALAAALYANNNPQTANMPVLAAVWIVSAITFFLGIMASMLMALAG